MNKYQLENEPDVDVLDIDNTAVREDQIKRLNDVRSNARCEGCLPGCPRRPDRPPANPAKATCWNWP